MGAAPILHSSSISTVIPQGGQATKTSRFAAGGGRIILEWSAEKLYRNVSPWWYMNKEDQHCSYPEAAIQIGASNGQVDLPEINREIQEVRDS